MWISRTNVTFFQASMVSIWKLPWFLMDDQWTPISSMDVSTCLMLTHPTLLSPFSHEFCIRTVCPGLYRHFLFFGICATSTVLSSRLHFVSLSHAGIRSAIHPLHSNLRPQVFSSTPASAGTPHACSTAAVIQTARRRSGTTEPPGRPVWASLPAEISPQRKSSRTITCLSTTDTQPLLKELSCACVVPTTAGKS